MKTTRTRRTLTDRIGTIDASIARAKALVERLENKRADMIAAEKARIQAALEAIRGAE